MSGFDPVLLAVLASRFESIVREMENTLVRTGRSTVLNMSKDLSCAIVYRDRELLATGNGLPVHVIGMEALAGAVAVLHPEMRKGDAYLHNDPYRGNTHAADHSIVVPVVVEGEHLFTAVAKAHQADCGNSAPTTYMPNARDVYEEGAVIFPAVKVQERFTDIGDVIRMCRARIRVPDQWYGDYLATLGAARIGELRIMELCERYGASLLKEFVDAWLDYSERTMVGVIRELPAGSSTAVGYHDPIDACPSGIPVRVTVSVDPDDAMITVDLRDNIDCVPAGVNQTEVCAINNAVSGVLNSIGGNVQRNSGSFRRINVLIRENCVVGSPSYPHSCSVATTNVADRIVVTIQRAFAEGWPEHGLAEGACGMGPSSSVISGNDPRRNGSPFINQKISGCQGGPGGPATDGWVTYQNAVTSGLMFRDSVEIDEQKYPIRIGEIRVRSDSEGAGRRRGAPGARISFGPRFTDMEAHFISDGVRFPPRGVCGGGDAAPSAARKVLRDGSEIEVPPISAETLSPGELLVHHTGGGGGYGDPLEREPERVRADVLQGFVSFEGANDRYGVVFQRAVLADTLAIDDEATLRRRADLRQKGTK